MSKITDYPPGPGINGSEQVLIATPAGPASTNYTYTMAQIRTYAGGIGGAAAWGSITGTLSAQSDLNTALGLKVTNPLTTTGDILVSTSGTTPGRLAIGSNGQFLGVTGGALTWNTPSGTGDVVGPASATSGRIAVYNGATGKLLQNGTVLEADVVTGPASATSGRVATYNGATGKIIQDGGTLLSSIPTMASNASASGRVLTSAGADKTVQDSGTLLTALAPLASPTFTGTPAAPTAAPGTNTTQIATTAYADAIAALKANLASPTFTGTPAAPTAAVDTNTTQIATTAFVVAQAASATPAALGTAAVGTSLRYARGDHVHSSVVTTTGDILYSSSGVTLARLAIGSSNQVLAVSGGLPVWSSSFALLASPVFTGDPTAPTPTTGDDDTSIATTAFVQASVTAIPQNSQSAAYTLVLSDKGKHIFHPSADTTARIWTIPANASVAFAIGTVITFVNQNAGGVITIAITTDTMRLAGAGTTGSRTLAANGIATAIKVTSTEWLINGTGLT